MNWKVVECAEPPSFPTEPKEAHNTHICFNWVTKENYHIKKQGDFIA
jgi:hypothetical protein